MWKHEARRRYVKYESIGLEQWVDMPTLIRDDGVSLALMGQGREKKIEFVYTDGGISFKFTATRYFDEGTVQTDTWTALLGEVFERLEK